MDVLVEFLSKYKRVAVLTGAGNSLLYIPSLVRVSKAH